MTPAQLPRERQPEVSARNANSRALSIGLIIAVLSVCCLGPTLVAAAGHTAMHHQQVLSAESAGQDQRSSDQREHAPGNLKEHTATVSAATQEKQGETEIKTGDAACCSAPCRPDDEPWQRDQDRIYLVNTRCLACPGCKQTPDLPIYRYDAVSAAWQPSSTAELGDDCFGAVATVNIHGNRIDQYKSVARSWAVYHEWVRRDFAGTRLVFIIWSWPSDRIRGQVRDVRTKAARTVAESYFLAHLISGLPPDTPVSLTGHSFGARIISGAAHLVAGGNLGGYRLSPGRVGPQRQLTAVLSAAAMHDYWLSPDCYHGQALLEIDRLLVLYNTRDPVLRFYRHSERRARPRALGYTGAVICGDSSAQVDQVNVACQIGREHSFWDYLCNPAVTDLMARYALFQPVDLAE